MIIVVEGISAAGKTTYSRQFGADHWPPEWNAKGERPGIGATLQDHARFWCNHDSARYQEALEIEAKHGFVVCDCDPMKIHYSWCMEQAGFDWPDKFEVAQEFVREAIECRQLGFADLYLVKRIDPDVARQQKEDDRTRRRGNFEQHLALQPNLIAWFEALASALPERVQWGFPDFSKMESQIKRKTPEANPRRFDVSLFDELVANLPG